MPREQHSLMSIFFSHVNGTSMLEIDLNLCSAVRWVVATETENQNITSVE
jgi:hypothetical protein